MLHAEEQAHAQNQKESVILVLQENGISFVIKIVK